MSAAEYRENALLLASEAQRRACQNLDSKFTKVVEAYADYYAEQARRLDDGLPALVFPKSLSLDSLAAKLVESSIRQPDARQASHEIHEPSGLDDQEILF